MSASGARPGQHFSVMRSVAQVAADMTVGAGASVPVMVAARGGIPAAGVSVVAVHVSVRVASGHRSGISPGGTVQIAPWAPTVPGRSEKTSGRGAPGLPGTPQSSAAHLVAYHGGGTTDGFALVGLGAGGALMVSNQGSTPVAVSMDVEGYATGSGSAARDGVVVPLTSPEVAAPKGEMRPGQAVSLSIAGHGVPRTAVTGLLVDVTARASSGGQLRATLSGGGSAPLADYTPGAAVSGLALVSDDRGRIGLLNDSAGPAKASVTVVGYLSSDPVTGGGTLVTTVPASVTAAPVRVAAGGTVSVPVTGRGGVPQAGATGVALGITVTPAAGTARPGRGDLSVGVSAPGVTGAADTACPQAAGTCTGFTLVQLSSPASGGDLEVRNHSGRPVLVSLDSFGYLAARTVPAMPAAATASEKGGSAIVTWHAPVADGGAAISGYAVTVSPGGKRISVSGHTSSLVLPGIRRNVTYTFTVAAQNAAGRGPAAVGQLIPAGTPGAPGKVSVRADGLGRFRVSWTPAVARGARITGYTVTAAPSRTRVAASATTSSLTLSHLLPGAVYVPCVTATSSTGATAQTCAAPVLAGAGGLVQAAATAGSGSLLTPVSPVRVMDTRNGTGGVSGPVAANASVSLQVAGVHGVPASGVTAVVVNVTVTGPTANGFLTAYPDGASLPNASNVIFAAGQTIPNLVLVAVGPDGKVDFHNSSAGTVQVIADLAGYFANPPGPPTGVTASPGNGQATVSWAAPSSNGGSAITGYTVTASPGGATATAAAAATSATVTGLTNGTAYTFTVTATNAIGTSASSAPSAAVIPRTIPGPPTGVTATAGNGQATVSWTVPSSNGGSAITGYTVTASPGGLTAPASGSVTSATVAGLTNGTSYTFTVTAANVAGKGAASAPSNAVTPSGPPGAPTGVTATAGNGQATVSWTAPSSTGGGPVISYTLAASPGTATAVAPGTATSATVTGLTNGTSYTFTVTAVTAGGPGPVSAASNAVMPAAPPGAPTGVTATAGNEQATVSWTAPSSNGGSPITGYTVTASNGATASASATARSATVTGLTNGTSYTFTVRAANAIGSSAASAASSAVTPAGPPGAPVLTALAPGDRQVTVTWAAPSDNGGSAIIGYTITVEPGGATYTAAASATSATVTGLTDGTGYTFTVTAANALGAGPPSDAAGPVTPVTVPGAPTAVTATPADKTATVSWTAPSAYGNQVIGYTVTASPGGATVTVAGTSTAATVTGLTDGTSYTFTVTATDSAGTGPASAASNAVTPGPVPGPPTQVLATAGSTTANVSWTAPASAGGSAISGYTVTATPGGVTVTVAGTVTSATVTGLTNGTAYRFTVVATNSYGHSVPSASSASVTPMAPAAPDAPFITNVTAEDSAVDVTWVAPDTGAANLTGYVLTATSGGSTVSTATEPPTATEATITGLANGTDYTFTIAAVNGNGTSVASPPSTPVAPRPPTKPMAPANLIAIAQNGVIQVGWVAPPDGGSPITGYTVSVSPATVSPVSTAGNTTIATVTGLTNGTAYTVSVTATNAAGTGPAAKAGPVTPETTIAPAAPTSVIASATAAGAVALQWSPPMDPGTATITSYTVAASTGGTTAKTQSVPASQCTGSPAQCSVSMSGLTATSAYTFTVTATSTAGTSPASAATAAVTPNVVFASAPVMLSSASAATLRYVKTDGTLLFEQPPSQVTSLAAGTLVYVPVTFVTPQGFLGKVDSVTTQNGLVTVTTSQATLNDVYSVYDTSMNLPVNSATAQLLDAAPGVSISRPELRGRVLRGAAAAPPAGASASPAGSPIGIDWSNGGLTLSLDVDLLQGDSKEGSQSPVSAGPVAHLEGSVTLNPILHADMSSGSLGFTIGSTVKADIVARFGVHVSTEQKVFLGKIDGPTIDVPVGGFPVPSRVEFTAYAILNTDGSVGIEYYTDYTHTFAAQCQIDTTGGGGSGCSPVDQDNSHDGGLEAGVKVYASMGITAGVQLGVSLQIAMLAGPEVTLTPELQFTADINANPWWSLDLKGNLGVAVTALQAWGRGDGAVLYHQDKLFTFGPLNLANAGGPLNSLEITPSQADLNLGNTQQFQATAILGGVSSSPPATWSVVAGPGTISSSGVYTATANGVAVVEADYNGMTARASVIIGPAVESDNSSGGLLPQDTKGLVAAAEAGWLQRPATAVQPTEYAVTAVADDPGSRNPGDAVYVPASATHAYVPGLTPGASYTLTVYAVGAGGGVIGSASGIIPLDPLPGVLAGSGSLKDIAVNATTGKPDDTGTAGGFGGASVSGNGQYVFFYSEARSNLAPAAIYNPASTDLYLLRKNLLSGVIDVASVGLDGHTPVPIVANPSSTGFVSGVEPTTNADGSAVVFFVPGTYAVPGTSAPLVHDFTTQSTWAMGTAASQPSQVDGLSADGTVADYTTLNTTSGITHIFRQVAGGAPQQVDNCPTPGGDTCEFGGGEASMSDNGNLITYQGYGPRTPPTSNGRIYVYNSSTGQEADPFLRKICYSFTGTGTVPYLCRSYSFPVMSWDGSAVAVIASNTLAPYDPVVTVITIGAGDGPDAGGAGGDSTPIALSNNGSVLLYGIPDTTNSGTVRLNVSRNGGSETAPQLSYTTLASASISSDGTLAVYTLVGENPATGQAFDYPGVYAWQP